MEIKSAEFICSNTNVNKCPDPDMPEYAFIGRSNVGKSSLVNMLTLRKELAKTSGKPGKTRLINHFKIDNSWYLVDLPGYGFAKMSKSEKEILTKIIESYILKRRNLCCVFVLIDSRHEPLEIDMNFFEWLAENSIPFSIVFTKSDKLSSTQLRINIENYKNKLNEVWSELPKMIVTSSVNKSGREEVLNYIQDINKTIIL